MNHISSEPIGEEALQPEGRTWVIELWDWTKSIFIAFVIVMIIHQFVFNLSTVEGQSMQPTLQDDERLFVNKIIYLLGEPRKGDIVILKDPRPVPADHVYLVKRVIGVPGDTIEIRDYQLYRNGQRLDEPYIQSPMLMASYGPEIVPDEHYFVLGDNRNNSTDSRKFGSVHESLIKGRAEWVVWPLGLWGGLD